MLYASSKLSIFMQVGEGVILDITHFECTYSLSEIPVATATIPLGREGKSGLISTGHLLSMSINTLVPVNVYVTLTDASGTYSFLQSGTYLLFSGFINGMSYSISGSNIQLNVRLIHWAHLLTTSSALSSRLHPHSPHDLSFASLLAGAGAAGNEEKVALSFSLSNEGFAANLPTNFVTAISKWFEALVSEDRFAPDQIIPQLLVNNEGAGKLNTYLVKNAIKGNLKFNLDLFGGSEDKLLANVSGAINSLLTGKEGEELIRLENLANKTVWELLVLLAKVFMFEIVILPDIILLVPYLGTLRSTWKPFDNDASISTSEIWNFPVTSSFQSATLGAVVVVNRLQSLTGVTNNDAMVPVIAGSYVGNMKGLILITRAPTFLTTTLGITTRVNNSTGVEANAFNPLAGEQKIGEDPAKVALDAFAQFIYNTYTLASRTGKVVGPIRFDICQGSSLKLLGFSDSFLADKGSALYASVVGVSYYLDADEATAYTAYDLRYIRSEIENESDDFTATKHPFYENVWTGEAISTREVRSAMPTKIFGLA